MDLVQVKNLKNSRRSQVSDKELDIHTTDIQDQFNTE